MKIRLGFVSNSSATSFTVPLDKLSEEQIHLLKNYWKFGKVEFDHDYYLWYNFQIKNAVNGLSEKVPEFCCGSVNPPYNMWRISEEDGLLIGETADEPDYNIQGYMLSIGISFKDFSFRKL